MASLSRKLFMIALLSGLFFGTGCSSFEIPEDYRDVRVKSIERMATIGFDRYEVVNKKYRDNMTELFNASLEEYGAAVTSDTAYEVTFTNLCVLFEAQHFSLNQFNIFSRDAYLFAKDVEFGVLYRIRVTRNGREVLPETTFQHVPETLYYFERSTPWWWPITLTVFPYYDYYFYDAESVSEAMVERVMKHFTSKALPSLLEKVKKQSQLEK